MTSFARWTFPRTSVVGHALAQLEPTDRARLTRAFQRGATPPLVFPYRARRFRRRALTPASLAQLRGLDQELRAAIAKQAAAAKEPDLVAQGTITPGFTVNRALTETSANRVVAGIETSNVLLTQIRDGVYLLRTPGGAGVGPVAMPGASLAASFATHALLAGNAELP